MKHIIFTLLLTTFAVPANAEHYGSRYDEECYKTVYSERYVPGNRQSPGYVTYNRDRVRIPCRNRTYNPPQHHGTHHQDDNSCVEGTIIGGLLGGAGAAAASEPDAMIWSIPLGIVGGGVVGCQIDGG